MLEGATVTSSWGGVEWGGEGVLGLVLEGGSNYHQS